MKSFFIVLLLITFSICNPEVGKTKFNLRLKHEIRTKILDCIISNERISENLKKNIDLIKTSKKPIPLIFSKIKMEDDDMEIIRACKREVFQDIKNIK